MGGTIVSDSAKSSNLSADAKEFVLNTDKLNADALEFTPITNEQYEEMESIALLEELYLENTIERELNAELRAILLAKDDAKKFRSQRYREKRNHRNFKKEKR